jgi:hypothetical protein
VRTCVPGSRTAQGRAAGGRGARKGALRDAPAAASRWTERPLPGKPHEITEMRDMARNPQDARAVLCEMADAATSARRAVRHVLEELESIIALRASAGRAWDIHHMRELADDLRAARRSANVLLRAAQRTADSALHVLGGESPHARARTRALDRAEAKVRNSSHGQQIRRAFRARSPRRSALKGERHSGAARARRPARGCDAAPA